MFLIDIAYAYRRCVTYKSKWQGYKCAAFIRDSEDFFVLFAKHYQTGAIIPDSLLNGMIEARNLQSGNDLIQQIFYGVIDLTLHENFDPKGEQNTSEVFIKLQNSMTNFFSK